jgi:hypothetical protein
MLTGVMPVVTRNVAAAAMEVSLSSGFMWLGHEFSSVVPLITTLLRSSPSPCRAGDPSSTPLSRRLTPGSSAANSPRF